MSLWSLSRALSLSCFPVHLCHSFLFRFFYALLHHWLLFYFPVLLLNRVHHLWHAWYVRQLFWNPSFILKSGAPTLRIHILFFWRKNRTFNFKHEPKKRNERAFTNTYPISSPFNFNAGSETDWKDDNAASSTAGEPFKGAIVGKINKRFISAWLKQC